MAGGLNLYGFASGDPVNYADPFGLCPASATALERTLCVFVETSLGLLGSASGFIAGGGAGLLASAPIGFAAAPVTVPAGAIAGAAAGGAAGVLAGRAATQVMFSKAASTGASAGGEEEPTAQRIISTSRKGSINREFPGQFLDKTKSEIQAAAREGDAEARKALKLLNDNRFMK